MIAASEVRTVAGTLGVGTNVIEHDYVLSSFLHTLYQDDSVMKNWIFKGGTALAKCYFEGYRFSEDLDFTITKSVTKNELSGTLDKAKAKLQDDIGIVTSDQHSTVETISDDYGKESLEAKIYYRGPMGQQGSPRSIRVHLNREEFVAFPFNERPISHEYSDKSLLPQIRIPVYSLEEMFVEKLRAISGQRRFAIGRDLYDIFHLNAFGIDIESAIRAFRRKCEAKGLKLEDIRMDTFDKRKDQYRADYERNLIYLVPKEKMRDFEEVWMVSRSFLERVIKES
jgi:predicted nucleotidyltransferase component of viral defense system